MITAACVYTLVHCFGSEIVPAMRVGYTPFSLSLSLYIYIYRYTNQHIGTEVMQMNPAEDRTWVSRHWMHQPISETCLAMSVRSLTGESNMWIMQHMFICIYTYIYIYLCMYMHICTYTICSKTSSSQSVFPKAPSL